MIEWIAAFLVLLGGAFSVIAALGLVRMPDVYIRMHSSTKTGTVGLGLLCIALMLVADGWFQVVEAMIILLFLLITAPIGAHLIGRASYAAGVPFSDATTFEPGCETFGTPRREEKPLNESEGDISPSHQSQEGSS
ncbi:monovalent cation/H(+) antiporter subunit G [Pontivivens ytuae]|uniref:Monovalent cation/H(+) antiporter subunit G n=1 Tax=Pontivivens ytuae TaxID=2789856 RepID=A0A7S9LP68_9RHOB|nr:monovalent cation/H(+) antiporter subunit G [Pontivivens ytuae]QPH52526.1 monovalent cation/H(+) antiporter subunit G [Pontivivens ytuae]